MVCHHFSATPAACQASSRRLEEGKGQGGLYTRGGGGGGGAARAKNLAPLGQRFLYAKVLMPCGATCRVK